MPAQKKNLHYESEQGNVKSIEHINLEMDWTSNTNDGTLADIELQEPDPKETRKSRTGNLHDYWKRIESSCIKGDISAKFTNLSSAKITDPGVRPKCNSNAPLDSRNILCPVPGCKNQGGKGFRRNGIGNHIMGQHPDALTKTSKDYDLICKVLRPYDKKICAGCNKITKRYTAEGFCDKCDEKKPIASKVAEDLTVDQREKSTTEFLKIQETKFVLRRTVPRKLYTLWSDIVTDIALGMSDATRESEARRALKRYLMLKAVLIKPIRGGGGRYNRNVNLTERLMTSFWKGDEDEVWKTAIEIEKSRQNKKKLRNRDV